MEDAGEPLPGEDTTDLHKHDLYSVLDVLADTGHSSFAVDRVRAAIAPTIPNQATDEFLAGLPEDEPFDAEPFSLAVDAAELGHRTDHQALDLGALGNIDVPRDRQAPAKVGPLNGNLSTYRLAYDLRNFR